MQPGHGFIGDYRHPRQGQERRDFGAGARQQTGPDPNIIGAIPKGHIDHIIHQVFSRTSGRLSRTWVTESAISSIEKARCAVTQRSALA